VKEKNIFAFKTHYVATRGVVNFLLKIVGLTHGVFVKKIGPKVARPMFGKYMTIFY
jgi:hypothetical protein